MLTRRIFVSLMLICSQVALGEAVDAATKTKLEARIKQLKEFAPSLAGEVKTANATPSKEAKDMTQDKWKAATVMDAFIRSFSKNGTATQLNNLKSKDDAISEAFVSAADGTKVGFLTKPTNWSHKGKPKHDKPMAGSDWIGDVETDESTGMKQVQVAIPVLDGGKAIGSLVVGYKISKL